MLNGEYESVINRSFLPVSSSLISSFLFVIAFCAIELCDVATKGQLGWINKQFSTLVVLPSVCLRSSKLGVRLFTTTFTTITAFYGTIILYSDSVERGIKRGDNFVDLNYVALFIGVLRVVKQFYIRISDRGAVCYILIDLVCIN